MTFIENLENKAVILKTLTYKRTKAVSETVITVANLFII